MGKSERRRGARTQEPCAECSEVRLCSQERQDSDLRDENYPVTCAVIGSFRRYYAGVRGVIDTFAAAGIDVRSPRKSEIVNPGDDFVFFRSDSSEDPVEVQLVALHRILGADFVYVYAPDGYVGRTTCYEIGRVSQAGIPIYFSHLPADLPILVPPRAVVPPDELAAYVAKHQRVPAVPVAAAASPRVVELHARLAEGATLDV